MAGTSEKPGSPGSPGAAERRPSVGVVMPFAGTRADAEWAASQLAAIRTAPGDRLLLVDNTPEGVADGLADGSLEVVHAAAERSSYYARNVGAERMQTEWLLFVDSDCRLPAGLLDDYLAEPVDEGVGILAGAVDAAPEQRTRAARYARSRGHIGVDYHLEGGPYPAGVTANLLVRRAAWKAVGGFHEGVQSGADIELCWRVQAAGWSLAPRPGARIEHLHSETIEAMVAKTRRHAAGNLWVNRRWPGSLPRPRIARPLLRGPAGIAWWLLRGDSERAGFKRLDMVWSLALARGYWAGDNRAVRETAARPVPAAEVAVAAELPAAGDAVPGGLRVEALARPDRPDRSLDRGLAISYAEDDPSTERARALARIWARHPLRCAADLVRDRGPGRVRQRALAPLVERVRASGAEAVVPLGRDAEPIAARVARLAGVRIGAGGSTRATLSDPIP
jgi:GT2 family glycosyltransferase